MDLRLIWVIINFLQLIYLHFVFNSYTFKNVHTQENLYVLTESFYTNWVYGVLCTLQIALLILKNGLVNYIYFIKLYEVNFNYIFSLLLNVHRGPILHFMLPRSKLWISLHILTRVWSHHSNHYIAEYLRVHPCTRWPRSAYHCWSALTRRTMVIYLPW